MSDTVTIRGRTYRVKDVVVSVGMVHDDIEPMRWDAGDSLKITTRGDNGSMLEFDGSNMLAPGTVFRGDSVTFETRVSNVQTRAPDYGAAGFSDQND